MTTLLPIPATLLDQYWLQVEPLLTRAAERSKGKLTIDDYVVLLRAGKMQLWAATKDEKIYSIGVTEISISPRKKTLHFLIATGEEPAAIAAHMPAIENWAKQNGCSDAKAFCRLGWEKFLTQEGYEKTHIVMEKTLI